MLYIQRKGAKMRNYMETLKKCTLFTGIDDNEIEHILNCLSATLKEYKKGDYIIHAGDKLSNVYLVLSGKVHIQKDDYWGNQSILTVVNESELFCESYACLPDTPVPINAVAITDCTVMSLNLNHIITTCSSACKFHISLIHNLLSVLASRNMMLTDKLEHIGQRSTRNKVLSYLSQYCAKSNCAAFEIPYNRQQLADYLSVDRSALSNELSKLRNDGIITYRKNKFTLLKNYED